MMDAITTARPAMKTLHCHIVLCVQCLGYW